MSLSWNRAEELVSKEFLTSHHDYSRVIGIWSFGDLLGHTIIHEIKRIQAYSIRDRMDMTDMIDMTSSMNISVSQIGITREDIVDSSITES